MVLKISRIFFFFFFFFFFLQQLEIRQCWICIRISKDTNIMIGETFMHLKASLFDHHHSLHHITSFSVLFFFSYPPLPLGTIGLRSSNQIKSLFLSHHHSTCALVSEILESMLQTVQKQFTYRQYILTDVYRRQCAEYTYIYSVHTVYFLRHTYNYQYTLCTVCTHFTLCKHIIGTIGKGAADLQIFCLLDTVIIYKRTSFTIR